MFIHEYYAYSPTLAEERKLDAANRAAAESAIEALNETPDSDWLVVVRVNVQADE